MALGFIKKITDFIMPLEPIEEEDYEEVERKSEPVKTEKVKRVEVPPQNQPAIKDIQNPDERSPLMEMPDLGQMRTAEGGSVAFGGMKYTAYTMKEEPVNDMKPQLTVVKGSSMSVKINKPAGFDEVRIIADDLLGKNVVVVNYELVDANEQRRISDFVNGVCYVTDGHVEQISEHIILYTPAGVDTSTALRKYSMR